MKDCLAVVLAAGKGTRMKSEKCKVMHEAAGKPVIRWITDAVREAGVEQTVLICGYGKEELMEYYGDEVKFAVQEEQKGTGHAVMMAKPFFEEKYEYLLLMAGDMPLVTPQSIERVYNMAKEGYGCVVFTAEYDDPTGYGRIIRGKDGSVTAIVEHKNATDEQRKIKECNAFLYCVRRELLLRCFEEMHPNALTGEIYLTDIVELIISYGYKIGAYTVPDCRECQGINDRAQLAQAAEYLRERINHQHMLNGVTIIDPKNTYIDAQTQIGADTVIYPGVILERSVIGERVTLYQGSRIADSTIGNDTDVQNSVLLQSTVGEGTTVGPYAYLRPGTKIGNGCRVGDFVEVKNSDIDDGAKVSHLTYIGDAHVGKKVNVGCGVVFVNYDGKVKTRSHVGDHVFIGCNTNLISPVNVGDGAYIAAGSTVTEDVPPKTLCIARARQVIKENWKDKRD